MECRELGLGVCCAGGVLGVLVGLDMFCGCEGMLVFVFGFLGLGALDVWRFIVDRILLSLLTQTRA